jgi:hypothetical protein
LAGATLGAIQSASLAVGLIGQGLALARGRLTRHAVKQVDRLLSNPGIAVDALLQRLQVSGPWPKSCPPMSMNGYPSKPPASYRTNRPLPEWGLRPTR